MTMSLIGNKRTCNLISSMINNRKIPHAIIIEGEEGLGKKTLAKYIAKACLCASDERPCMSCKTCHLIDVGSHPDYQIISPDGANIKVDQIRELRSEAYFSPLSADGRVFVIDMAHTMNQNAQNALLKVLEEPPKGVTFILLSKSASLLLETIRSRSVILTLSPVPLEQEGFELVSSLANVSINDAEMLLTATDGNIGQAVASAGGDILSLSSVANEILTLASVGDRLKIISVLQPYTKQRDKIKELIICLKASISNELKKKAIKEYSSFTADKLNFCYSELSSIQKALEFNPSLALVFCRIAAILTT